MAEDDASLALVLGDDTGGLSHDASSTPLDLLLNAINGSSNPTEDVLNTMFGTSSNNRKRKRGIYESEVQNGRIKKTITEHLTSSSSGFSHVTVWHPNTAQKSYKKEKRMLNPPPTLRVSGPLLPLLTSASLTPVFDSIHMTSQTHRIPLLPEESRFEGKKNKEKLLRESAVKSGFGGGLFKTQVSSRERQALSDGLAFSGLWVSEEIGKNKEFSLELTLGNPGDTTPLPEPSKEDSPKLEAVNTDLAADEEAPADGPAAGDSATPTLATQTARGPPAWATLPSLPLSVVSKPSQKTVKARNLTSCLTTNDPFALFCRINSQTVRTKFLKMESGPRLASRTGQWTPFKFNILNRAPPPEVPTKRPRYAGQEEPTNVLTYGSIVNLVDSQTGIHSEPVRVVKVEHNEVREERTGHPISELQRIAFLKIDNNEARPRWFLGAPGARAGGGELLMDQPGRRRKKGTAADDALVEQTLNGLANVPEDKLHDSELPADVREALMEMVSKGGLPPKRIKTKRNALALATLAEGKGTGEQNALEWVRAEMDEKVDDKATDGQMQMVEHVPDWMSWVITGVSSFTYSFFNGLVPDALPSLNMPLDPIPRLLAEPVFHHETMTIDIILAEFHLLETPLDIFLGPIGPLAVTTWRSTAPTERSSSKPKAYAAESLDGKSTASAPLCDFPGSTLHVLVRVEMPDPAQTIDVMTHCAALRDKKTQQETSQEGDGWVADDTKAIHDALKHAEEALIQNSDEISKALQDTEQMEIDPALSMPVLPSDPGPSTSIDQPITTAQGDSADEVGPLIQLVVPAKEDKRVEFVALPFLMLRSDGVGFGVGKSVIAFRRDGLSANGTSQWGLRVVPS